jgi:hypothetical protein
MSNASTISLHARNDKRNVTLIKSLLCLSQVDDIIDILNKNISLPDFDRAVGILDSELQRSSKGRSKLEVGEKR